MAPIGVTWLRALRAAPSLRCCLRAARAPRAPVPVFHLSQEQHFVNKTLSRHVYMYHLTVEVSLCVNKIHANRV